MFFSQTVAPREPQIATASPTPAEESTPSEIPSTTEPRETTTVPVKGNICRCTMSIGLRAKYGVLKHTGNPTSSNPRKKSGKLINFI